MYSSQSLGHFYTEERLIVTKTAFPITSFVLKIFAGKKLLIFRRIKIKKDLNNY